MWVKLKIIKDRRKVYPEDAFLIIISLSMILKFVQMEEVLSTETCMTSIVDNLPSLTDVSDSQSNYALNMFLVYL